MILSIPVFIKDLWSRALLHGVHYRDRYGQLDFLYKLNDPWNLNSPGERVRYQETNNLIQREFGRPRRLLELGCGEGYQSQYLARVCDSLHGCDISARAVQRARDRCTSGTFSVGSISDLLAKQVAKYDVVVACEVLYYIKDVQGTIDNMSKLGDACLVTYYESQRDRLDRTIVCPGPSGRSVIRNGEGSWIAVWWHNPRSSGSEAADFQPR